MSDHDTVMARALRLAVVKNLLGSGNLDRDDALELLNAPLSPDDPMAETFDDREKLDWTTEQFETWMKGDENAG
jgi:hypothetical protein